MTDKIAEILDVNPKTLYEFDIADPFNNNTLQGFLCKQSDHRYGSLVITSVNNEDTRLQVIYATPKLHYPFGRSSDDGERKYNFPKFVKVHIYDKLDGTNILQYSYADSAGNRFITYKTRLVPVVSNSRFGDFYGLWCEILQKYPEINDIEKVKTGEISCSYELYGYRNKHLIEYDVDIDARLLFAVKQKDASVILPEDIGVSISMSSVSECKKGDDLISFYNDKRAEALKLNIKNEDGYIKGTEGFVFYVLTDENKYVQIKCKSEDVEALHWVSDSIPKSIILPTVWNALESTDVLTVSYIKELLLEEFEESVVDNSKERIKKCIDIVVGILEFREKVKTVYESADVPFNNKGDVMRYMSKHFERNRVRAVYTALKEMNLIKE